MDPNHPKDSSPPKPPTDKSKEPWPSTDGDAKDQHAPRAVADHLVEQPSTSSVATSAVIDHDSSVPPVASPSKNVSPGIMTSQPLTDLEKILQYCSSLEPEPTYSTLANLTEQFGIPAHMLFIPNLFSYQHLKASEAQRRESQSTSDASEVVFRIGGEDASTSEWDCGQAKADSSQWSWASDRGPNNPLLTGIPHRTLPLNTQDDAFIESILYGPFMSTPTTSTTSTEGPSVSNSDLVATFSQTLDSLLPSTEYHEQPLNLSVNIERPPISGDVTPAPDVTSTDEPLDLGQASSLVPSPAEQRKIDNADGSGTGAFPLAAGSDTMDSLSSMMANEKISVNSPTPSHSSSMTPWLCLPDFVMDHVQKEHFENKYPNIRALFPEEHRSRDSKLGQSSSEIDNASELAREGGVQLEIDESDDQKKVDDDDPSPGEDA